MSRIEIDADIRRAATLPARAYTDSDFLAHCRERVFARSWQLSATDELVRTPRSVLPVDLLPGCLDEPIVWTRDEADGLHCLSNVCTHRANLVAETPGRCDVLRCRYHGRRFGLDGRFVSMPEFDGADGFPSPADDLKPLPWATWNRLLFAALDPSSSFEEWIAPVEERVGSLPVAEFALDAGRSRDYLVRANWIAYCDNYLEGFHIPFVHAGLAEEIDYGEYRTELFPAASLQLGIARGGEATFDLPASSRDTGHEVAAYYFFLFPNLMLNFYPWGLSINVVRPLAVDRTKVSFWSLVWREELLDSGAGAELDRVEREDEAIVENVQRGLRSRLYSRGRYSPTRETGVHHFHRLIAASLK